LRLGAKVGEVKTIFIAIVSRVGVGDFLVLQWPPLSGPVVFIAVEKCGLGACVFERVDYCEVEMVFNWSEGECTVSG